MPFRSVLLCASLITTGCYTYVPTSLDAVRPGDAVRMRISGQEAERLEPIRFTDVRALEGAIVSASGEELFIDALIRTVDPLGITAVHTQRLNIPAREIQSVEYRRLDRLKTGAAAGGVALVLGAAAYAVLFMDLSSTDRFEPVDENRLPAMRLPLLRYTR